MKHFQGSVDEKGGGGGRRKKQGKNDSQLHLKMSTKELQTTQPLTRRKTNTIGSTEKTELQGLRDDWEISKKGRKENVGDTSKKGRRAKTKIVSRWHAPAERAKSGKPKKDKHMKTRTVDRKTKTKNTGRTVGRIPFSGWRKLELRVEKQ